MQTWPAAQTVPQAPQLVVLVAVLTGRPPHWLMSPLAVNAVHRPLMQLVFAGHTVPGLPQLKLSAAYDTHAPSTCWVPAGQLPVHVPLRQACPGLHVVPHAPHCANVLRPTQRSVQRRLSAPQAGAQVPPAQDWVGVHAVPHCPQLALLVVSVAQAPLQLVWPGGHVVVQEPLTQACPDGHARLHAPPAFTLRGRARHSILAATSSEAVCTGSVFN